MPRAAESLPKSAAEAPGTGAAHATPSAAPLGPGGFVRLLLADPFARLALLLLALAIVQAPVLRFFDVAEQSDVSRWNEILLLLLAIGAQFQGRRVEHVELRRHGRLLTLALSFWLSAHGLYFAAGGWDDPWVSAAGDLLYVLYYLCMLAVALGRPHLSSGWSRGDPSYRFGLAGGAAVLFFFFAYTVVPPLLFEASAAPPLELSYFLFVTLDLLLLGRFVVFAVRVWGTPWREVYGLLALAWTGWMAGDFVELLRYAEGGVEVPEAWSLLLQSLSFLAILLEARVRARRRLPTRVGPRQSASSPWNEISPLLAIVFVLPAMHLALHQSGWMGEELRPAREIILVGFVLGLGVLTSVYQFQLERRGRRLAVELAAAGEEVEKGRKMEAVGRVAGLAAHGFNNLLTVIQGNAELLRQRLDERKLASSEVVEIESAAKQAAAFVAQLLAVSRRQVLRPDAVDLNELLRQRAESLPASVRVELALDPELDPVLADGAHLGLALDALIENAVEAMPEGGVLALRTRRAGAEPGGGEASAPGGGRWAILEVEDSGAGIAPEVRERLFEPFVSTKPGEPASGLGLATVYGFVRQSGGEIGVASRPGEGSCFRLRLPCVESVPAPVARAEAAPPPAPEPDAPWILVVDDEPALRALAVRCLTQAGYRTLAAGDAAEASAHSAANPGRIALLLSDIVLPGLNGRRLAEKLLDEQPQMQVLLMSGYTQDAFDADGVLPPGFGFLQKPFSLELLRETIRRRVGSPATL